MPLTIVCRYPGILGAEARGPELPSPRSAAPHSGAVLRLRRGSAQALPQGQTLVPHPCGTEIPRLSRPVQLGLLPAVTHPQSQRART